MGGGAGCAASPVLLKMAEKYIGKGAGPSWPAQVGALFALLSPLLVLLALRAVLKSMQRTRRRYERYQIMTDVVIRAGDREFRGSVSSLSMGGVRVDTNALLEEGGKVQMKILSPDGTHEIEVAGEIVWSEKEKAYGVAFSEIGRAIKKEIAEWQKTLVKAAS
jgi:c-di-GMP-binding flagellar brake protein YcgR